LNRRTFVRGAAGAVGMGAVGALSPALESVGASERRQAATPVKIPVSLEATGRRKGEARQMVLVCPGAVASPGEIVEWDPKGNLSILLVQFKGGRTPFLEIELPEPVKLAVTERTVRKGTEGGYNYLIVAKDAHRTYALDPPLDIVPGG